MSRTSKPARLQCALLGSVLLSDVIASVVSGYRSKTFVWNDGAIATIAGYCIAILAAFAIIVFIERRNWTLVTVAMVFLGLIAAGSLASVIFWLLGSFPPGDTPKKFIIPVLAMHLGVAAAYIWALITVISVAKIRRQEGLCDKPHNSDPNAESVCPVSRYRRRTWYGTVEYRLYTDHLTLSFGLSRRPMRYSLSDLAPEYRPTKALRSAASGILVVLTSVLMLVDRFRRGAFARDDTVTIVWGIALATGCLATAYFWYSEGDAWIFPGRRYVVLYSRKGDRLEFKQFLSAVARQIELVQAGNC